MSTSGHQVEYSKYEYAADHWAISTKSFEEFGICTMKAHGHRYIVMLNPTTRNGYRLIVRLLATDNASISSTHNRKYTKSEINGLFTVLGQVANMLIDDGLIGQVYVLGNNSHSFDKNTKNTIVGQKEEPSMLHAHVIYRGDPKHEYIDGIKLEGNYPGFGIGVKSKFDKVQQADEANKKIPWQKNERDVALKYFKQRVLTLHTDDNPIRIIDNTLPFEVKAGAERSFVVSGAILFAVLFYLFNPSRNHIQ